jgi:glutamate carboxypeptidase
MQRLLERLVRQSSFTQDPPGVNAVVSLIDGELQRMGIRTERIPSPRFGDHLFFRTAAKGEVVFLLGHTDTVFPPGSFEGFEINGDMARGPGAFDMKGGLVVALFALETLARGALLRHVPVQGLFVSDEEVGSPDSTAHLRERAAGATCALCLESGRPGDAIITQRKGVSSVHAEAVGVSSHAGNDHQAGKNAIWSLARLVDRAQSLTDYRRGATVNVGTIEGGTSKNTVPAHARAEIDLRYTAEADGEALFLALREAAETAAVEGTRMQVVRTAWRPPMVRTERSAALAGEYGACQEASGLRSGEAPLSGGGSDACTTSAMGVPTVDGLGPRGAGYHTTDETVDVASLVPKAAALARFLGRRAV